MTIAKRPRAVAALLTSGLLLIAAASCSREHKPRADAPMNNGSGTISAVKTGAEHKPAGSFVANPFCRACHLDFDEEELALDHELAGVGCERCHGESLRHRSDEANVTPPEIMYPRDKIIPTCMMCHPRHEIRHVPAHDAFLAGAKTSLDSAPQSDARTLACTDCHAKEHRIKVRTIRWNKATGERL